MERPLRGRVQFKGGTKFADAFPEGIPTIDLLTVRLDYEMAELQSCNAQWAEDRLCQLRIGNIDPLLDILLVDEDGEVINAISSYSAYAMNAHLALSSSRDLAGSVTKREKFIYPLTGENDTAFFWNERNDSLVMEALECRFDGIRSEDYSLVRRSADGVKMCRVKGGLMGKSRFADNDIVYGRLGFWVNNRLGIGPYGAGTLIERARFDRSKLLPKATYVSPLNPEEVVRRGGNLMELKYPNIDVVRVDPGTTGGDFIIAALQNCQSFQYPVVLGYSTLRPWLGEVPKHGKQ